MPFFLSAIRNPQSEIGTSGSRVWQIIFLSFAVVLILFEIIRGWRLGILRQLMRVAAVIAGYAAAFFGGNMLVPLLRPLVTVPDMLLSAVGGAILAVLVYAVVAGLGRVLFKRTAQHSSSVVRLAYGLSGAVVGFFSAHSLSGSCWSASARLAPSPMRKCGHDRKVRLTET